MHVHRAARPRATPSSPLPRCIDLTTEPSPAYLREDRRNMLGVGGVAGSKVGVRSIQCIRVARTGPPQYQRAPFLLL